MTVRGETHVTATVTCDGCGASEMIVDEHWGTGLDPNEMAADEIRESDEWHMDGLDEYCDDCWQEQEDESGVEIEVVSHRNMEVNALVELLRAADLPLGKYRVELLGYGDILVERRERLPPDAEDEWEWVPRMRWSPDADLLDIDSTRETFEHFIYRAERAAWTGRVRVGEAVHV